MKYIKTLLAICLAALWLPSCTNEDLTVAEKDGKNTYMAHVTMTAERGMFGISRSVLEDNKDGKLTFSWEKDDVVYLTDTDNEYKGTLTVVSVSGGTHATFEGTVSTDVYDGKKDYVFYFLGNKSKDEVNQKTTISAKSYDFSKQDGLLSSLSGDDLLIGKAPINFVDGKGSVNVSFKRQFAYAHYKLVYNGAEIDTKDLEITISADNLASTASVDFVKGDITPGEVSSFTVTPSAPDDEKGFYVALVPNNEETTLTFTCTTKDGTHFIGTRTLKNLVKNNFYRLSDGFGAIPIEMNPARQYRVFYNVNLNEGIDGGDPRTCVSVPYLSNGAAYQVLSYTSVQIDGSEKVEGEAAFTKGYLHEFLGWGTEKNAEKSWREGPDKNWGAEYYAKEDDDDEGSDNAVILDLSSLAVENVVDGVTYYDVNLYAKGSVMQYKYEMYKGNSLYSGDSKNRLSGWTDLTINTSTLSKPGSEFLGWSRMKDGVLVDKAKPLKSGDKLRIMQYDEHGTWNPNYEETSDNRKVIGQQLVKLYPVFKEIENSPVSLPGYDGGTLE